MRPQYAHFFNPDANIRIGCVGDVILDTFIDGAVARISREAPIPVFAQNNVTSMIGGAGNVVCNLTALGIACDFFSIVGTDPHTEKVRDLLDPHPIKAHFIDDPNYTVANVLRYRSQKQHLFRVDGGGQNAIDPISRKRLVDAVDTHIVRFQVLILSDYDRGVLDQETISVLITMAKKANVPVIVDPRKADFCIYSGATMITPNVDEVEKACGKNCHHEPDLLAAGRQLVEQTGAHMAITRSEAGISLLDQKGHVKHYPTSQQDVIDVSGAGDTVVAVIAVAIAAGLGMDDAIILANIAAGIVITKSGTAPIDRTELLEKVERPFTCSIFNATEQMPDIKKWVDAWHNQKLKIGLTNGCFDILHPGHIHVIHQARLLCDRLIVAINGDASVQSLKGPTRPMQNENHRSTIIAALRTVDMVIIFEEKTPHHLIRNIIPDLLVKGADYREKDMIGADIVKANGGHIHRVPLLQGYSSTATIDTIQAKNRCEE